MDGMLTWFRSTLSIGNGDVDGNGVVNVLDVIMAVSIVLGTHQPTEDQLLRADIDGNGQINVVDILSIIQIILSGGAAMQ